MITGFGKYLIDNAFKRFRYQWIGKKQIEVQDYESEFVSTYGPLEYCYKKGDVWCYWGLNIKDHPPKFFIVDTGRPEDDYFDTSDHEKALQIITEHCAMINKRNKQNDIALKRYLINPKNERV